LPSFNQESKLSTWIYTIAKRVIYKYITKERNYSLAFLHDYLKGEDRIIPDTTTDFDKELWIKQECDRCLTGIFHCLGNDARMIYVLRDIITLPYFE
jgi:RNA polymerase sigma-70 factor (ECF subfamily)